jgi:hypothetical protein
VINDDVCAWPTYEISDGGSVLRNGTGRAWSSLLVEIVDAAKRIDKLPLKKRKKLFRLTPRAKCDVG